MNFLIVPTIRENSIKEFIRVWEEEYPNLKEFLIVIEDNPTKTFDLDVKHHYSWKEITDDLGDDATIISKRDSSIRSYGFLKAWQLGSEYIFTLDDDCYPYEADFFSKHIAMLEGKTKWESSIVGMRTRGFPYQNFGKLDNVVLNMGLWTENPDYDAVQTLINGNGSGFVPPSGSRIIPNGQYSPICGMSMCFRREVAVLSYFAPMGEGQPYRRFDDIWFGIIFKKICDHLRLLVAVGEPFIKHIRTSNPFVNLVKEATGIGFNESFWEIIDGIQLSETTPKSCLLKIAQDLINQKNDYLTNYGSNLQIWTKYF